MGVISHGAVLSLTPWRRRLRALPACTAGAAMVVVIAALITLLIATAHDAGARPLDPLAYGLGSLSALVLLLRKRWPLAVLLVTVASEILYHVRTYPGGGPWPAILVALYTAALIGQRRRSLLVGALIVGSIAFNRTFVEKSSWFNDTTAAYSGVSLAMLFLGEAVRSRRALLNETRERIHRAELEQEAEAGRRVAEERLRIARELHDVLAHTITVITVQAGVATDLLETRPDLAGAALRTIREASRDATRELRATLGVLRNGDRSSDRRDQSGAPREPAPGLGQVASLIETATSAGLRVELATSGDVRPLPAAVDLTAYRIVQEALTNVLRHARATTATVTIRYEPVAVVVEVDDNGRGPVARTPAAGAGHGLMGMAERAAAVRGCVQTGAAPGGGFRVLARLPYGEAAT